MYTYASHVAHVLNSTEMKRKPFRSLRCLRSSFLLKKKVFSYLNCLSCLIGCWQAQGGILLAPLSLLLTPFFLKIISK